jgi:hypothetical protein
MRHDEIAAVEGFREYLLSKGMRVEPREDGEDPPDFYVTVERERFAVEVTNLMDEIETGGADIPRLSYTNSVHKLTIEIEEESRNSGTLRGHYVLWVNGPFENFSKLKKHIKSKSMVFLEQTKNTSPGYGEYLLAADETGAILTTDFTDQPPEVLQGEAVFCFIWKKDDCSNHLSLIITSPKFMDWKVELERDACKLLQRSISEKCDKLKDVTSKRILLLPDLSRFMDLKVYQKCVAKLHGLENFHSILVSSASGDIIAIHGPW